MGIVLEINMGIVNPDIEISLRRKKRRGDEVDEPLPCDPKRKVLKCEVECDPQKHAADKGGSLITNSKCQSPKHCYTPTYILQVNVTTFIETKMTPISVQYFI